MNIIKCTKKPEQAFVDLGFSKGSTPPPDVAEDLSAVYTKIIGEVAVMILCKEDETLDSWSNSVSILFAGIWSGEPEFIGQNDQDPDSVSEMEMPLDQAFILVQMWKTESDVMKFLEEHGPHNGNGQLLALVDHKYAGETFLIPPTIYPDGSEHKVSLEKMRAATCDKSISDEDVLSLLVRFTNGRGCRVSENSQQFEKEIDELSKLLKEKRPNLNVGVIKNTKKPSPIW